jgi:hypothetical protein
VRSCAGESEAEMAAKADICVCKPQVMLNNPKTAVMLHFEVMNPDTFQGTGKHHTLAMTTLDAMRLLKILDSIQKQYDLPQLLTEPEHTKVPPKRGQN